MNDVHPTENSNLIRKIVAGTVGFGLPYGNRSHDPLMPASEVELALQAAWDSGIRSLDTAPSYGISEQRIGNYLRRNPDHRFVIATKIPSAPKQIWSDPILYIQFIREALGQSLIRLSLEKVNLLQFHQSDKDFIENAPLLEIVEALASDSRIDQIGASIYEPSDLEPLVKANITIFQIPLNVLNQKFLNAYQKNNFDATNCEFLIRSVFLQGLLHDDADFPVSRYKEDLNHIKNNIQSIARQYNLGLAQLALDFISDAIRVLPVYGVILGMNSAYEIKQNLQLIQNSKPVPHEAKKKLEELIARVNPTITDPRKW